jgi:hypothetical protein
VRNDAHYRCRASVGWRLAAALYTKAGGTPKNVAPGGLLDADMAYVGMPTGYANPAAANPAPHLLLLNVQRHVADSSS